MSESGDDFGLVLQSALIFLSAIAAIASYIIQSRLKSKEHNGELNRQHNQELRKIRLQRVREKLDTFVGPASQISSAFWYIYFTTLAPKGFYPRKLSIGPLPSSTFIFVISNSFVVFIITCHLLLLPIFLEYWYLKFHTYCIE